MGLFGRGNDFEKALEKIEGRYAIVFNFVDKIGNQPRVEIVPFGFAGKYPQTVYFIGETEVPRPKTYPPIYVRILFEGKDKSLKEEIVPIEKIEFNEKTRDLTLIFDRKDVDHFLENYVLASLRKLREREDIYSVIFKAFVIVGIMLVIAILIGNYLIASYLGSSFNKGLSEIANTITQSLQNITITQNQTQQTTTPPMWVK